MQWLKGETWGGSDWLVSEFQNGQQLPKLQSMGLKHQNNTYIQSTLQTLNML